MGDVVNIKPRMRLTGPAEAEIMRMAELHGFPPRIRMFSIFDNQREYLRFSFRLCLLSGSHFPGDWEYQCGQVALFVENNGVHLPDGELDFVRFAMESGFTFRYDGMCGAFF